MNGLTFAVLSCIRTDVFAASHLFLIYVNDINRHVHLGSCNIYADDTLIYCTGNNITELKYNI